MVKTRITVAVFALFMAMLPMAAAHAATGGLLMSGTITDSSGTLSPGATVSLYAWPAASVLDGLQSGQAVPTTLLANVTSDARAGYALSVSPSALAAAAVDGTNANLEVTSGDASWFFVEDTANPAPITGVTLAPDTPDHCTGWIFVQQLDRAWASIGSTYIWRESPGVTGSFVYDRGQSSTLGIGISETDIAGSYKAGGTESSSSDTKIGFPNGGAGDFWEYQTEWRTAKYKHICNGIYPNQDIDYMARANSWLGGQKIVTETGAPATSSAYCAQYLPGAGSFFQTTTEQNKTWTGSLGLSIGGIGFDGSAVTGYDSSAQLTYNFTNATHTNYVCGTNTYSPNAARTVVQSHT